MKMEDEIVINKYGQGLIDSDVLLIKFNDLDVTGKQSTLNELIHLIMQSKATDDDIHPAIKESKLKPSFTPCVLLKKGVATHNLNKIKELPPNELSKSFLLLLSLFRIAYQRRYQEEKNNPDKWWYWDLSDENKVKLIIEKSNKT
jgi:hypothetical protein